MIYNVFDLYGHLLGMVNELTRSEALEEAQLRYGDRRSITIAPCETAKVLLHRR